MIPGFSFSNLFQKSYSNKQPSYQTAYYQGQSRTVTYAEYQNANNAGGNFRFTFAKLNQNGYGVNRTVTYAEYQNPNAGYYGPQNSGSYQENLDFSLDYDVEGAARETGYPRSVRVVPYRGKSSSNNRYPRYPEPSRNGSRWNAQQLVRYSGGNFQNNSQYGYSRQYNRYGGYSSSQNRGSHRGNFNSYSGARRITCYTCGEEFSNKTALFAHRNEAHSKRNYYCPVCNKEFGLLKLMKEHEKTHTIQACPECPEVFKFKESLTAHKEHAHSESSSVKEPAKTDTSNDKSGFKNFASPVAASTPAASFSDSTQDSGIHVKLEPHSCPHCIKSFDSEQKLALHSKVHTDPQPESTNTTAPQSSDKLSCPFCIKKFLTRREIVLHLDSAHTTTYYCRKCSAEYSTQSELDTHMKVHT